MRAVKNKEQVGHGFYNSGGKHKTRIQGKKTKACQLWENLRIRCQILPDIFETRFKAYSSCTVYDEWKDFQVFAEWFEKVKNAGYYLDSFQLDKDLLFKGNKVYSPDACVFLPRDINSALTTRQNHRGVFPLGVCQSQNAIEARFEPKNHKEFHARKRFNAGCEEEAFNFYKTKKEEYLKFLAEYYKEAIDPRAYHALINYKILITD